MHSIFLSLGFTQCAINQAVFYKFIKVGNLLIIVVVHIDDCTIAASTCRLIKELIKGLEKHVKVTNLGELHWMLGIEIQQDWQAGTIHLRQRSYIDAILCHFHLSDSKPLSAPMDPQVRLSTEQAPVSTAKFTVMRDVPY